MIYSEFFCHMFLPVEFFAAGGKEAEKGALLLNKEKQSREKG